MNPRSKKTNSWKFDQLLPEIEIVTEPTIPTWEETKAVASSVADLAKSYLSEEQQRVIADIKNGVKIDHETMHATMAALDDAVARAAKEAGLPEVPKQEGTNDIVELLRTKTLDRAPVENEIDLVARLESLLEELGHSNPKVIYESQHIREVVGKNSNLQMMNINRFLLLLGSASPDNTRAERFVLQDTIPVDKWLSALKTTTIPGYMSLGII